MLTAEENRFYSEVGAGTPMGELFRRFWWPALLSAEVPRADCDPVRVKIMGQRLLAFRDTNGTVAITDELCPHRRASLYFGRNEDCGIRCVYHGWKFDVSGACVDMPNEPSTSRYRDSIRLPSYPVHESADLVWVYLGPAELTPQLPDFEWMRVPSSHRIVARWFQESNWAQGMEGEIDSSHLSFLHAASDPNDTQRSSESFRRLRESGDGAPRLMHRRTSYGFVYGAQRIAADEHYWRLTHWLMPTYSLVPSNPRSGRAWIPVDDETTCTLAYAYRIDRPFTEEERAELLAANRFPPRLIPGTLMPLANASNDYLLDREIQRTSNFTGIAGVNEQDRAIQESMGRIVDRSQEHLGKADFAIVQARRTLMQTARDLRDGVEPPAAGDGSMYAVRAFQGYGPDDRLDAAMTRWADELAARYPSSPADAARM